MHDDLAIGVDLGGTRLKYAVVSQKGDILWEKSRSTGAEKSRDFVIQNIADCILEAQAEGIIHGKIHCAGIGSPGLVNIRKGEIMGGSPNLPEWEKLPLASIIQDKTGLPVYVDNDANLMGLGEYIFGYNSQGKDMIFLTIGTGIGGAIIIDGNLYRGYRYAGSELGCIPMHYEGKTGYWEDFASTAAMVDQYSRALKEKSTNQEINGEYVVERYQAGEQLAGRIINEHINLLGEGIAGLINIFNPEQIVIGGGISESGKFYIDGIRNAAEEYAMKDCIEGVKISAATLGNKAGFMGAAHFAQLNELLTTAN